jgi:hypothetical protein
LALTSPTSGGRSVGIVRSRAKAKELVLYISKYIIQIEKYNGRKPFQSPVLTAFSIPGNHFLVQRQTLCDSSNSLDIMKRETGSGVSISAEIQRYRKKFEGLNPAFGKSRFFPNAAFQILTKEYNRTSLFYFSLIFRRQISAVTILLRNDRGE